MANGRAMGARRSGSSDASTSTGRARRDAGFDLLTLSRGLGTFPIYFLYPFYNKRTDEYGGIVREPHPVHPRGARGLRDAIDDCAIGPRFVIDTLDEPYGFGDLGVRAAEEGREFIARSTTSSTTGTSTSAP